MRGADFMIAYVDSESKKIKVEDRFSLEFAMPEMDYCQDWKFKRGNHTDGWYNLELERKLVTNDNQDRHH